MYMKKISKKQKEIFGLLQIGTLLEYFDIMIFVHFSFLLNDLFFPKTDPHTSMLIAAFAFCSAYVLRPVGALIFGFIGDKMGRKPTVIISSFMMGFSCILMANMPTYDEVGIIASYGVTFCRILQSISAQGELIGVEIYLTETTKKPNQYVLVSLTSFFASLGGLLSITLAVIMFKFKMDWRLAYWCGAAISSIGFIARTHIYETPIFLKKRYNTKKTGSAIMKKSMTAYFVISCGYPICFYLSYIYLGVVLKNKFNYSVSDIMINNFYLAVSQSLSFLTYSLLCYRFHPLKILYTKWIVFALFLFLYPFLDLFKTPAEVFISQLIIISFGMMDIPGAAVFIEKISVLKRFMYTSMLYAFSRISMYILTSFGVIYITDSFGKWGIWMMFILFAIIFYIALNHFIKLDKISILNKKIHISKRKK